VLTTSLATRRRWYGQSRIDDMIENAQMGDAANALREVLCGWIHGDATSGRTLNGGEVTCFVAMVERNRLDALMWVALPDGALRQALAGHLEPWRRSYEQSLIRNMQQQRLALNVCRCLEEAGILCIGLRGPFAGDALYGDVALRHFTDIDLLIPVERRDQAWEILTGQGYRFNHPFLTRSACTRHHLEWPFRHLEKGLSLDLHWAVDHPYKPYRIDYAEIFRASTVCRHEGGTWRSPCRSHAMLLACIHAEKECRLLGRRPMAAQLETQGAEGRWRHWLDVALEGVRGGPGLDWNVVLAEAEAWGVKAPVVAGLTTAATLFDVPMPSMVWQAAKGLRPAVRLGRLAARIRRACSGRHSGLRRLGFRAECLFDAWRFIFPDRGHFACASGRDGWCRRVVYTMCAGCRLASGALEWVWLKGRQVGLDWFNRRRVAALIVMAVAMVGSRVAAHDFGDDVSDESAGAEELSVNGGAITRALEIDRDEDWFMFSVEAGVDYTVAVGNVTLFDSSLERYAEAIGTAIAATNTLPYSVDARLAWVHSGISERVYVRVSGMFEFTTGTYHIAVSSSQLDTDDDGLPDVWEFDNFGDLTSTDGTGDADDDGVTDFEEYMDGTNPNVPADWVVQNDFDGDGESDLMVLDQQTGRWFARTVGGSQLAFSVNWGWSGVEAVAGDYDGDGIGDLAVFDQNTGRWFIRSVSGAILAWDVNWGWPGVEPVSGDFDGDGIDDLAVFDQNTGRWFIRSLSGDIIAWNVYWGWPGVQPVSGDYDGDGVDDLAVLDQNTGRWFVRNLDGDILAWQICWGWAGVTGVSGDFDGDEQSDLAVFDVLTGRWFIRTLSGDILAWDVNWGWSSVSPVSGDYDGDGVSDLAIFDDASGRWFICSLAGEIIGWNINWGWPGVQPVGR